MQEVQPSLEKSIHLFWSGEGSPESTLPGVKHLDPLLQMAQRHQPTPPDKGFLGTWSALGGQACSGVSADDPVTTLARTSAWDAPAAGPGVFGMGLILVPEAWPCSALHVSNRPHLPGVILACSWCCHKVLTQLARGECINLPCLPFLIQPALRLGT